MEQTYPTVHFTLRVMKEYGVPVNALIYPFQDVEHLDLGLRSHIFKFEGNAEHVTNRLMTLEKSHIYLFTDLFYCNYYVFHYPDKQSAVSIGPFLFKPIVRDSFKELLIDLNIPSEYENKLYKYYSSISVLPSQSFIETLILQMGKDLHGENCRIIHLDSDSTDFWKLQKKNFLRLPDEKISYMDFLSMRHEAENNLISAITSGNLKLSLQLIEDAAEFISQTPPRLTNELRDKKIYVFSFISIIRKSLELKGMHPIYIDETTRDFVVKIEECNNLDQLDQLITQIITTFCKIANEYHHKTHSPLIDTILTYIDTDLSGNISLNNFARNLNVNASYLSTLFSKEMGMSLTDYVTSKRIERAKHLLGLTDYSIKMVAEMCGYSDIYHFSRTFKKHTGISPKNFHNSFYKEEYNVLMQLQK